jgi:hypothetical protein
MDYTPILRADALDDEMDLEPEAIMDEVPVLLPPCEYVYEPYENGEGGWSYRRVVVAWSA